MAETSVTIRPLPTPHGVEKAAILLATLGPEAAAGILRHLSEHEVRQVSGAIARLRSISHEQAAVVHEEAWRRLSNREGVLVDGERFASQIIDATLSAGGRPSSAAARELKRATQAGADFLASSLESVPAGLLAQVLANEHPQMIALVLANLRARQAAEVLRALPEELQPDIVHRITELQNVPEELLTDVGDVLQELVQELGGGAAGAHPAGAKLAAQILNAADEGVESRVFTHLESAAPELAEAIRNLMFTFEDLLQLDNRGMQTVLKEVSRDDLILALKTASPGLRDKIFANMSQRAVEILKEDMSTMGPVKLKDVEAAQANVVATVRRLEQEQKITIAGGAGGDVVL
jgi:flagellar motor switch protein FliG